MFLSVVDMSFARGRTDVSLWEKLSLSRTAYVEDCEFDMTGGHGGGNNIPLQKISLQDRKKHHYFTTLLHDPSKNGHMGRNYSDETDCIWEWNLSWKPADYHYSLIMKQMSKLYPTHRHKHYTALFFAIVELIQLNEIFYRLTSNEMLQNIHKIS